MCASGVSAAVLAPLLLAACSEPPGAAAGGGRGGGPVEFPVEVAAVETRNVDYSVTAVGSVEAFERVQSVARIPGGVERVLFAEGDSVQASQVLVEIEPARYRIEVDSARAEVAKADASLADARAGLARREGTTDLFPAEDLETWRTRVRVAEAELAARRATLARAELNLRDAFVRATVPGVIETRSVETGQYVTAGTVLATLVRREPLLLRFEIPEPDAAPVVPGMLATFTVHGDPREWSAEITHVGGEADLGSRMVAVTARVTDPARRDLRPGAFAQVRVRVGSAPSAPVIPQTAIRPSERGFLAYVVEDGTARERVLELGLRTADGRVEVRRGLEPGEQLVVRGAEALRDGVSVRVEGGGAASAAAAS